MPRTSYDPGPVPPASSEAAPMSSMNALSWNDQMAFEKRPAPMSKRRFVMQTRNILNAVKDLRC